MTLTKQEQRAFRALEAARNSAKSMSVRNHLEDIQLYVSDDDVYASDGTGKRAATGNWNTVDFYDNGKKKRVAYPDGALPERLGRVLEKLGFECEWSDEWTTCDDCGKLVRTQPDSYFWKPFFVDGHGGTICKNCAPAQFAYGNGSVGCLHDNQTGPYDSKEDAAEDAAESLELTEDERDTLIEDGILYLTDERAKEVGAQVVEVFEVDADWTCD